MFMSHLIHLIRYIIRKIMMISAKKQKKREIRYAGSTVPACTRKDIPTAIKIILAK